MERVDKTDKSFQFFFGAGCGSKTIIYVAAKKFWFGTVELIENFSKTSFEKNCFSAWASTLNMGLINKVDMVCLSPVGYGL